MVTENKSVVAWAKGWRQEFAAEGQEPTFGTDKNVLSLDYSYMVLYTCQNSLTYTL